MINNSDISKYRISLLNRIIKRLFDFIIAIIGLLFLGWLVIILFMASSITTKKNGFFTQIRIGKNRKQFKFIKIRTMRDVSIYNTTVTTANDPRITRFGRFLRNRKLDELPQLINVLLGHMSFVGPRPDVPGFADQLQGEDRIILSVRPGITGPATLYFRDEERKLADQVNPDQYNREVLYPKKIMLNRDYIENYSFRRDLKYIFQTIFGGN